MFNDSQEWVYFDDKKDVHSYRSMLIHMSTQQNVFVVYIHLMYCCELYRIEHSVELINMVTMYSFIRKILLLLITWYYFDINVLCFVLDSVDVPTKNNYIVNSWPRTNSIYKQIFKEFEHFWDSCARHSNFYLGFTSKTHLIVRYLLFSKLIQSAGHRLALQVSIYLSI